MAHYAVLDDNNVVVHVFPGKNELEMAIDWEEHYSQFVNKKCKRTSFNTYGNKHATGGTPFRMNYAGVGFTFREDLNAPEGAFVPPQPYPSWTLNESTCLWEPPVPRPESDQYLFEWDENSLSWVRAGSSALN